MSEQTREETAPETATPQQAPATEPLSGLMAGGEQVKPKPAPDLDAQALRAAEAAIAEGERALAQARAQLQQEKGKPAGAPKADRRGRELLLRGLLVFNVLAMIVVAMLPSPTAKPTTPTEATDHPAAHTPQPPTPAYREPFNRAMAAAEARDFGRAMTILDDYLADSPRMAPGEQLDVLNALTYYAGRNGDTRRSQEYRRRADALENSHSLPEDLVAQAKAAMESGNQAALRSTWARFLLQQKQIPSWLYKHVAEAYLELGDSYRKEAAVAAEQQRIDELKALDEKLRTQVLNDAKGAPK